MIYKHIISEEEFIICQICKKKLEKIDGRHTKKHNLTFDQYKEKYPYDPTITRKRLEKELKDIEIRKNKKEEKNNQSKFVLCCNPDCPKKGKLFSVNINASNSFSICKECKEAGFKSEKNKENYEKHVKGVLKKYGVKNVSNIEDVVIKRSNTFNKNKEEDSKFVEKIVEKREKTIKDKYGDDWRLVLNKKSQKAMEQKYGVKHALQRNESMEKFKQTNLKNLGVEYPSQLEEIREKQKQTCLKNLGVENPLQSDIVKEKIKQTNLDKYGVESHNQVEEIKQKKKQTNIKNLGVEYPMQSEIVKNKSKQTNLENIGVEYPSQSEEVQKKIKQTNLKNCGFEYYMQSEEFKNKYSVREIKKFLPKLEKILNHLDLELVDNQYNGAGFKHNWKCKKCGYEFKQIWNSIQQGYMCPKCYPRNQGYSKAEKEIAGFIKSFYDIKENDRQMINPRELDIYIPCKNIAVEFDGLYWHSDEFLNENDARNNHINKTNLCIEKGIKLIHIFEDEWIFKEEIVKSRLKQILNVNNSERIHARKCEIKEVDPKSKNEFLEKYHIQGKDSSVVKLGAFYEDNLIALMTFSHGNIAKGSKSEEDVWELNRFCSNYNYHIPGIASKLLTHFKRNYKWKEIFSYADRRWSNGNLYYKLGFELDHITKPNYWYLKDHMRIHRFILRKKEEDPKDIPEWVLRQKEGFFRIWDCGNMKFIIKKQ